MTMADNRHARRLERLAQCLVGAQQIHALYPAEHPRVGRATRELYLRVCALLEDRQQLRLALVDGTVAFDDAAVPIQGNELLAGLAALLKRQGADRLVVRAGVRRWEIAALVQALNTPAEELAARGGIDRLLAEQGAERICAGPIRAAEGEQAGVTAALPDAWRLAADASRRLEGIRHELAARASAAALAQAMQIAADLVEMVRRQPDVFVLLHGLKSHDAYSFAHSVDVALLSLSMARALGLSRAGLLQVGVAALLHDLGKERIPLEILNKPDRLTDREWEIMRRHGPEGAKMLLRTPGVPPLAVVVAYEHHLAQEEDDPDHGGWPLHLASQLVCIADVYDALRSHRPYRKALPSDEAMRVMEAEAAGRFDPDLFAGFRRFIGYYPPGTCVLLDDGHVGIVTRGHTEDPERPVVLSIRGPDGRECVPTRLLDLLALPARSVTAVLDPREQGIDPLDYF